MPYKVMETLPGVIYESNPNSIDKTKLQQDSQGRYNITISKHMVEARDWTLGKELTWKVDGHGKLKEA